jgi:hypothetical protein
LRAQHGRRTKRESSAGRGDALQELPAMKFHDILPFVAANYQAVSFSFWSMIRKSVTRFSEEIMLDQATKAR